MPQRADSSSESSCLTKATAFYAAVRQSFALSRSILSSAALVRAKALIFNPFQATIMLSSNAGRGRSLSRNFRSFLRLNLRIFGNFILSHTQLFRQCARSSLDAEDILTYEFIVWIVLPCQVAVSRDPIDASTYIAVAVSENGIECLQRPNVIRSFPLLRIGLFWIRFSIFCRIEASTRSSDR